MVAKKPAKSKQKRGKIKASKVKATEKDASKHVKFDEDGSLAPVTESTRINKPKTSKKTKKQEEPTEADKAGGKKEKSPEMIQQAKYYLETWKRRNEPPKEGELPWKFKVNKYDEWEVWFFRGKKSSQKTLFDMLENQTGVDSELDVRSRRCKYRILAKCESEWQR